MPRRIALMTAALLMAIAPAAAFAEAIALKLLPNYSRATFKSDAALETFVGNTAAEGVAGTLTLDPARPQTAVGSVKVRGPPLPATKGRAVQVPMFSEFLNSRA